MWKKTKKAILAIELIVLLIISVFVASILTGNAKNASPVASASADVTSGNSPLNVNFRGSGSDRDGAVVSYLWDFGDGTTSKSQNPTHVYQKSGKYIATLTVTDNDEAIGRNKITIDAQENSPSSTNLMSQQIYPTYAYIDFSWSPEYPDAGEKVTFTTFYGGTWNFGDGTRAWGSVVSHTYTKKGRYTVTLTALVPDFGYNPIYPDNLGPRFESAYATHYVAIGASPFPKFTWSPTEPAPGQSISFDASESSDTNGQIVKYNWSYTDASEPNKVIELGENITFDYTLYTQGIYNVTLVVTDNDNNTNEITKTIIVSILKIDEISSGFRRVAFQVTNIGNITAENIQWNVYVGRNLLVMPLWKIFSKTGTINTLSPGESRSIDISRYRRGFGMISMTISVGASNAIKITKYARGFMFSKYIHLRL